MCAQAIFVRLWYAEITDDAGSGGAEEEIIAPEIDEDSGWKTCPGIGDAGIPGWFDGFFVSKIARFAYASPSCVTSTIDNTVFWGCVLTFFAADVVLFLPPYLSRLHEKSLAEIVATEERLLNYNSVDEEKQEESDDDDD